MKIDFTDSKQLEDLMARHEEFPNALIGKSIDGEDMMISICEDRIITETYQDNGWTRKNIFYKDGSTEELFDK